MMGKGNCLDQSRFVKKKINKYFLYAIGLQMWIFGADFQAGCALNEGLNLMVSIGPFQPKILFDLQI